MVVSIREGSVHDWIPEHGLLVALEGIKVTNINEVTDGSTMLTFSHHVNKVNIILD